MIFVSVFAFQQDEVSDDVMFIDLNEHETMETKVSMSGPCNYVYINWDSSSGKLLCYPLEMTVCRYIIDFLVNISK